MLSYSTVVASLALFAGLGQAKNVNMTLDIESGTINNDGFPRSGITVSGTSPGPVIVSHKFDQLNLNVRNHITDPGMRRSTTIHWHGLFQNRTNSNDGPAFVTQCPISPNTTFLYTFPLHEQTGTFWYHSHHATQYCDGLRGALVIYDPDDPFKHMYDVDDLSTVITLSDYYHQQANLLEKVDYQTAVVPIPDSVLINGVGRFQGGPKVPFSVINVEHGKRYRFRVVNIACRPFYSFSIDSHNMTVIEADGIESDPLVVDQFDIFVAQRYSVIVTANQPIANYWIRAPSTGGAAAGTPGGNPNLNNSLALAVFRYKGAPKQEPAMTAPPNITNKLLEQNLHTAFNPGLPAGDGPADVNIVLNITQPHPPFWEINGISWVPPSVPALLQILSGAAQPQDFIPSENLFVLPRNKTIEVNIPGPGAHPFHLHGHAFDVIQSSNSATRNFKNAIKRDVVAVNGGNTTIRFFTDNPGPWIFHCHIDWHLEVGLSVIMGEAPEDNVTGDKSQIVTDQWRQLCANYDALPPELQ